MKIQLESIVLFLLYLSGTNLGAIVNRPFENHKLYHLSLNQEKEKESVQQFADKRNLDIWSGPAIGKDKTHILVNPETQKEFHKFLNKNSISSKIVIRNLADIVEQEAESNGKNILQKRYLAEDHEDILSKSMDEHIHEAILEQYASTFWIYISLRHMSRKYKFCSIFDIGSTYEGRKTLGLKIAIGPDKPILVIDAGIHAREWLAPATAVYMIDKIMKEYSSGGKQITKLLEIFEIQILPVVNPDGYDFTHKNMKNRLFRKNRRPTSNGCVGVDINRNFDFHWGEFGGSGDSCRENYHGPYAFSESETINMRDHFLKEKDRIKMSFSLHCYSQLWFIPYSHTMERISDYDELMRVAKIGNEALLATHGRNFDIGQSSVLLYYAGGTSFDWAKSVGIKYSYALELRPGYPTSRKNVAQGFLQPASAIKPSGEEILNGIVAAALAATF